MAATVGKDGSAAGCDMGRYFCGNGSIILASESKFASTRYVPNNPSASFGFTEKLVHHRATKLTQPTHTVYRNAADLLKWHAKTSA
jgi:hypothetical protein